MGENYEGEGCMYVYGGVGNCEENQEGVYCIGMKEGKDRAAPTQKGNLGCSKGSASIQLTLYSNNLTMLQAN